MLKVTKLYNFDEKEEYKLYNEICKNPSHSLTYTQWKSHVLSHIIKLENNTKISDFKHYLISRQRQEKNILQILISILVPLYIFFLTVFFTLLKISTIKILILALIILLSIVALYAYIYNSKSTHICLFEDIIIIIDEYNLNS